MKSGIALMPCEVAAKSIIPSIRAAVAKILVEEYGVPRYRVARLLNTSPAAVTNYLEGRRGNRFLDKILSDPELLSVVRKIGERLAEDLKNGTRRRSSASTNTTNTLEYQKMVCIICSSINPLIEDREAHLSHVMEAHFKDSKRV